jgi:hypothetical protein
MIQTNEIRIGNSVFYNGDKNEIGVITEIKQCFDPLIQYVGINGRQDLYYQTKHIKPIPLTEEWLVKFGFTDDVVNVLENDNFKISISYYDGWHLSYKEKQGFGSSEMYLYPANIDSVHSLQNLFHSFTGQELTLKE